MLVSKLRREINKLIPSGAVNFYCLWEKKHEFSPGELGMGGGVGSVSAAVVFFKCRQQSQLHSRTLGHIFYL